MELITEAHAQNFNRHRVLVDAGRDDASTRELLRESARIAVQDAPAAARDIRAIALDQSLAKLLDPTDVAAEAAVHEAIAAAESALSEMLRTELAMAAELASLHERED